MPVLIPAVYAQGAKEAFGYTCSECEAAFTTDRPTPRLTRAQVGRLNDLFLAHCEERHPNAQIAKLEYLGDEDFS